MSTHGRETIFTDFYKAMGLVYTEDIDINLDNSGFEFTKWTFNIRRLKTCIEALSHILDGLNELERIDLSKREAIDVYVARKKDSNFGIILLKPHVVKKGLHIALAGLDVKMLDSDDEEDDEEEAEA